MRCDRIMRRPTPSLREYALSYPQGGRPPKHGKEFRFAKPETWGEPDTATTQVTDRYGTARAMAWDRIHPRLTTRSAVWLSERAVGLMKTWRGGRPALKASWAPD
jgi:hypothetical protein